MTVQKETPEVCTLKLDGVNEREVNAPLHHHHVHDCEPAFSSVARHQMHRFKSTSHFPVMQIELDGWEGFIQCRYESTRRTEFVFAGYRVAHDRNLDCLW